MAARAAFMRAAYGLTSCAPPARGTDRPARPDGAWITRGSKVPGGLEVWVIDREETSGEGLVSCAQLVLGKPYR